MRCTRLPGTLGLFDAPRNVAGHQRQMRTGGGYLALAAYDPGFRSPPLYQYIYQRLDPDNTGEPIARPGRHYYGELSVSLADTFGTAVREIGMYLSADRPSADNYGTMNPATISTSLLRTSGYDAAAPGTLPPAVIPQIHRHVPTASGFLDDKTNWLRVAGCFEVPVGSAPLKHLIVGNFNEESAATTRHGLGGITTPGSGNDYTLGDYADVAMYYITNVRLHEFPTAGPDVQAACSALPTLGQGCILPLSSGAQYQWSFRAPTATSFAPILGSAGRQLSLLATQEGDYQLVVSVPEVDGSGIYSATTQCHVTLTAPITLSLPTHFGPLCPEEVTSIGVTLTATGGPSGAVYTWESYPSSGGGVGNPTVVYPVQTTASIVVHPTRTTIYRVRAQNGPDVSCWTYTTVEVSPAPVVASGGPYVFAEGAAGPWLLGATPPAGTTAGTWVAGGGLTLVHQGNKWLVPTSTAIGTYPATYTYTDPVTGCSASATTTISVQGCLSRTGDHGIALLGFATNGVLSPVFTFQPYTRYFLDAPLTLEGADYTLPEGCEVLCDPAAKIFVGKNARLILRGATLTATCDQMWLGVQVLPDAYGVYAGTPGYDPVQAVVKPRSPDPAAGVERVNEISHARTAIRIENPEAAGYRLTFTQFLHNERNIELGIRPKALPSAGVITTGDIINCTFDADPGQFKQPLRGQQTVSEFALSTDVWDMSACTIAGNYIAHMLVGIFTESGDETDGFDTYVGNDQDPSASNLFNQCYLAGVAVGSWTTHSTWVNNDFWLPSAVTLWNTPQRQAFVSAHPALQPLSIGAKGIYLFGAKAQFCTVTGNEFVGNTDGSGRTAPLDNFGNSGLYTQTGLQAKIQTSCSVSHNICTNLATGFDVAVNSLYGTEHEVAANSFVDCGQGIGLRNNWQLNINTGLPVPPFTTPKLWVRCNSFARSSDTEGDSYGIVLDEHATVSFEAPSVGANGTAADVMKNLFTGTASRGAFTHVWNDDVNPVVSYRTFSPDPNTGAPLTNTSNLVIHNVTLAGTNFNNVPQSINANDCGNEDGIWDYGILTRPATGGRSINAALSIPVPNPVTDEVTLAYELPSVADNAELLIRESLQGDVVRRVSLIKNEHEARLSLRDLRPGLYLVSLLVNGQPMASRRLQIAR